jgi:predicted RNase H-like nuclease
MLQDGQARAADKRRQRLALMEWGGLDPSAFTSIDRIDSALCALAAYHLACGDHCLAFGEPDSGLIVVPQSNIENFS